MGMEAETDRERLIKMDGKIDRFGDTMERIAKALDRLETVNFKDLENRIDKLEDFKATAIGAVLFAVTLGLASIFAWIKSAFK